jgi:hypothetical protein
VIGENDNYGHVERHYPSMTIEEQSRESEKDMVS